MTVIAVLKASRLADDDQTVARTSRRTPSPDSKRVPGRLAGYVYAGAHYCIDCACSTSAECAGTGESYTLTQFPPDGVDPDGFGVGLLTCSDEVDYPGASCSQCGDRLETNVLVYHDGGAHPDPLVEIDEPGSDRPPVEAFVLGDADRDGYTNVMLVGPPSDGVEPGTVDTVADHWIVEEDY